jgi:hypothetical protein
MPIEASGNKITIKRLIVKAAIKKGIKRVALEFVYNKEKRSST